MIRTRRIPHRLFPIWVAFQAQFAFAQTLAKESPPPFPRIEDSVLAQLEKIEDSSPLRVDPSLEDVDTTLRRITSELATLGRLDETTSPLAALAAIRIDAARPRIIKALLPLRDPESEEVRGPLFEGADRGHARDLLRGFSQRGLETLRRSDLSDVAQFDDAIRSVFQPILAAMLLVAPQAVAASWPEVSPGIEASPIDLRSPTPTGDGPPDALESWRDGLRVDHPLHRVTREFAANGDIADELDSFPGSIRDLDLIRRAWEGSTTAFDRIVSTAGPREGRDRMLEILGWSSTDDARNAIHLWTDILDLINGRPELEIEEVTFPFRNAARRVLTMHREAAARAVAAWFDDTTNVARFSTDRDESPLRSLRESASSVECLMEAQILATRLSDMAPGAGPDAIRQIVIWTNALGGERTGQESRRILLRLHADMDRFQSSAQETIPATRLEELAFVSGSRIPELLASLAQERQRWVQEIAAGEANGPARDRIDEICRLLDALQRIQQLDPAADSFAAAVSRCNLWGGWFVPIPTLEWTHRTLVASARLATLSAISRTPDSTEDLERIERSLSLIAVVQTLDRELSDLGLGLSTTPIDAITPLVERPGSAAWGLPERIQIAEIARGTAELRYLQGVDRPEQRNLLESWLRSSCEDLLGRWSHSNGPRKDMPAGEKGNDR